MAAGITSLDLREDEAIAARIPVTRAKAEEVRLRQTGRRAREHGRAVHPRERILETGSFKAFPTCRAEFLAWGRGRTFFFNV